MEGQLRGKALTLCAKPQVQASEGKNRQDLVETENRVDDSTFWGPERLAVDIFSLARC